LSQQIKKYSFLAWLVCGLGAVFYSYEYLLRILPSVMAVPLSSHYGLSSASFGWLSAFYYYAYVPMQIPVGILMDKYGPRRLLTLGCFLCAFGAYLFALTPYFWVAATGRFLVGLGSSFAFVGVLKLATLWLPEDKLGMVAGLAAALGTIGAMIGDNLLGSMVISVGWKDTVNLTAAFGFFLVIVLWFWIKDKKETSACPTAKPERNSKNSLSELKLIASNKQIWINGFYGCLVYLPTTVFAELWGIPYLKHAHNMTQEAADWGNSVIFLGFTFGAPIMGWISDKIHRRKFPMAVGAFGAFFMSSLLLYSPGLTSTLVYIILFVLGFFYSSQAIVFAVGRENAPLSAAGTAMAFTNMIVMLGGMFVQPLVGWLLDLSAKARAPAIDLKYAAIYELKHVYTMHDYRVALFVLPLGIFIAYVLTFFLRETYARADHPG
jgi:MFS family permease